MSMIWVVILALGAGVGGGSTRPDRDSGRPATVSTVRANEPGRSGSPCLARKVGRRPYSTPWSAPGLEEFDTEEVDETWMVHLDAMTSVPVAWLAWSRPRTAPEPTRIVHPGPPSIGSFPLRC